MAAEDLKTKTIPSRRPAADLPACLRTLTEEERGLFELIESLPLPVAVYRDRDRVLLTNRRLDELLGYARGELWGQDYGLLFPRLSDRRQLQQLLAAPDGSVKHAAEVEGKCRDGAALALNAWVQRTACGGREGVIVIVLDVTTRKAAERQEAEKREVLERLLDVSEHDRELICYEIHDGVVQQVTAALMHLEAAHRGLRQGNTAAVNELQTVAQLLREGLAETRRLIDRVRPPDLEQVGLIGAVQTLVARLSETAGIAIEFDHDVAFDRLRPQCETGIYRIVQESLHNVRRHSRAKRVTVELRQHGDQLQVLVRDNGVGFDPRRVGGKHFGLAGIRQRAKLMNGTAHIDSAPQCGTTVCVDLPVAESQA